MSRMLAFLQWLAPAAILALLPKCPLCLAAYLALFTGVGMSFTTASYLRTGLIVACIGMLLFLLVRVIRRNHARPSRSVT